MRGPSMFGLATGIDYGVRCFGAFAGAVFYVATAVNISRLKLAVRATSSRHSSSACYRRRLSPVRASSEWTGYSDRPLDVTRCRNRCSHSH